ncbi:hypothetical protein PLICRDRAFT_106449 [Plicaturopsis crispa FD-325 SS-3]|nr:hypothetical protein PLICRDRAFT_106449 [Plicaturopsis crispa FD-325 SS-3]
MGFTLPSPTSPAEQARALIARKEAAEAELDAHFTVLRANNVTLRSPLVDSEGFPRDDIDIYAVRGARVRIIELRNDLEALTVEIGRALENIYNPALVAGAASTSSDSPVGAPPTVEGEPEGDLKPFAKVNGVAPGSPAADAGLQREDLVLKFGHLTSTSFSASALQPLAELVNGSENRPLPIKVLRTDQIVTLRLTPKTWGGRGMLGCHIVPYSPP